MQRYKEFAALQLEKQERKLLININYLFISVY